MKGRYFGLKTNHIRIHILFAILLFITSCTNYPSDLKDSLKISGENKKELIKVLDYYNQDKKDSLKLKAAIYLIKNMQGLYSLDTNSVACNDKYFNYLDTMYNRLKQTPGPPVIHDALDKYYASLSTPQTSTQPSYVYDLEIVSADLLIQNIDFAFNSWYNNSWSRQMSFDTFCEYILPYRSTNTYLENSKKYFGKKYEWIVDSLQREVDCFKVEKLVEKELKNWFREDASILTKHPYLNPIKFSNIVKGRMGNCEHTNALKTDILRALGVPAAMEIIPYWGNHNNSHSFYKVLDAKHDTIIHLLTNINSTKNVAHIVSGTSICGYTNTNGIPSFILPLFTRTIPKVFRQCYTRQPESLSVLNSGKEEIPSFFADEHLLDVTDQYLEVADVVLNVNSPHSFRFAYLCVFDINGWKPVHWAQIAENGDAIFRKMGKNVVYLPAFFKNGEMLPCGSTFLLEQNGVVRELADSKALHKICIWRKYPYSIHMAQIASYMIGAKFQGSNESDLSDRNTFYTISSPPYGMQEIQVSDKKKYRYLIYQFDKIYTYPAEIEFYGIVNDREEKLSGTVIGNKGYPWAPASFAWDGDRNTFYQDDFSDKRGYVGIDLGKGKESRITRIRYCPRNDTNEILPNLDYELFYWNNGWVSLGSQVGKENEPLIFDNAPQNALFWVHTSTGKEERIFTYENGKQVFW